MIANQSARVFLPFSRVRPAMLVLGLLLLFLAHGMSLVYRVQPAVSLWFPPSGFAIAFTLWVGPLAAVLTGLVSVAMAPSWGIHGWARWLGVLDGIEPLVAWVLYCYCFRGSLALKSLRDAIAFLISAPVVASTVSAMIGCASYSALGLLPANDIPTTIARWWVGNAVGTMAIAPPLLLLTPRLQSWGWLRGTSEDAAVEPTPPPLHRSWVEIVLILNSVLLFAFLTVQSTETSTYAAVQFSLLSSISIFWAVVRFGARGGVVVASLNVFTTLVFYLLVYPDAIASPQFPINSEVLYLHKLSLLLQCAIGLLAGTAITEGANSQVALAVEQVRLAEAEARAQLSQNLFYLNRLLTESNQQIQESEARFRTSVENMLDCFGVYSAIRDQQGQITDFRVEYVNEAACRNNHMTLEQQLGRRLCEILPAHRVGLFEDYCRVVETGEPLIRDALTYEDEYGQRRLLRAFDIRAAKFGDGFVATWRDVTDRRQAEDELHRRRQAFEALVENSPDIIARIDPELRYVYVSPIIKEATGFEPEALIGQTPAVLGAPEELTQDWLARIKAVFDTGQAQSHEFSFPHPDGSDRTYHAQLVPEFTQDGTVASVLIVSRDVTELKQVERERADLLEREQSARQQAESASRMKDEFLAIVSHELRSPLNAMLGWSRLLRTRKLDETTVSRALEAIERNAQAQTQLIEDLLDISRIIRGKVRLNLRPIQLAQVVDAALDTIRPTAATRQITMTSRLSALSTLGDAERLQQVVWNLLSNAVKFTPDGGQVEVRLERVAWDSHEADLQRRQMADCHLFGAGVAMHTSVCAQITITDRGKGISPDFLPYVFDRFRQADGTTTRTEGGLGLGLAIVRNLVELHGGSVFADSAGEGQGATFTVQLPLLAEPDLLINELNVPASPTEALLAGLRVLIVDDDADTRDFLTIALTQVGITVLQADSVRVALQQLTQKPDLLLSDIGMPDQDGYELIRQVRSLPPEEGGTLPAAALTAYVRESDRLQALAAGFDLHIPKPIDPTQLLAVVSQLAESINRS